MAAADFDGITDPMPVTRALLQQPASEVPYKRGKLFKRSTTFINIGEDERIFILKHHTMYWINDEAEEYPRSRIKFDEGCRIKREDAKSIKIKTPHK